MRAHNFLLGLVGVIDGTGSGRTSGGILHGACERERLLFKIAFFDDDSIASRGGHMHP